MLSVIIPAYNEEKNIERAQTTISGILAEAGIAHELIFIDDGSKDGTWDEINRMSTTTGNTHGISFSRNFGKESAIYAGLAEAQGDCSVVIDCDLQHPPVKIVEMYRLWEDGYEIVEGVKTSRGKESAGHGLAARMFYSMISNATGIDMSNASDFKLLDSKAVNVILNMKEKNSFFRALSAWVGFKTTQVEYEVQERVEGTSKWSTKSLISYAITNITSFTSIPLQLVTILGALMFVIGVVFSVITLYQWAHHSSVEGFTTVIILQCFSSSIIMMSLGIIGYYIAKIYEEIKHRPKYIISHRT